jgi:hypothetical protein
VDARPFAIRIGVVIVLAGAAAGCGATRPAVGPAQLPARQQQQDRIASCAKGPPRSLVRTRLGGTTGDLARKAVVACEQPPRSEPKLPLQGANAATALQQLAG